MKLIVKRHGHNEPYDPRKLYASIYYACMAVRCEPRLAELIAGRVVDEVNVWLKPKHEVTSRDILRVTARSLHALNPDASYLYEHHEVIS